MAPPPPVTFRRATPEDAYDLARATFLANERVDMQTMASQLGIGRATLHRWVQTRENLLDRVLGELAAGFFQASRDQAIGDPDDRLFETVRIILGLTATWEPLRGFIAREPELALRLLMGRRANVRTGLLAGFRELLAETLPEEADQLEGFATALVHVGLALAWPTLVAGDEPSSDEIVQIGRALLAGARAGELPG